MYTLNLNMAEKFGKFRMFFIPLSCPSEKNWRKYNQLNWCKNSDFGSFWGEVPRKRRFLGVLTHMSRFRDKGVWLKIDTITDQDPIWVPFIPGGAGQYVHPPGTPTHLLQFLGSNFQVPFPPNFEGQESKWPWLCLLGAHTGACTWGK